MRILALHSDFIEFEAKKKAIQEPEELKNKSERVEECLVILTSVEKRDEKSPETSAKALVKNIKNIAEQVKEKKIVLYPYVHLSSSPSDPKTALKVLDLAEAELKNDFEVHRSPFGWYKSFNISVKGHPLSELSREFGPEGSTETKKEGKEEEDNESLKQEKKLNSYWHILDTEGNLHEVNEFNYKGHEKLKKFAFYEKEKSRAVNQEPAHVALMKKLELVDYEPASDGGNLRYYPKGRLIKKLIEEYVSDRVIEYGGVEVETPIMYDMNHPTLAKYLQRFPARQYQIESDKRKFFLRFAACFGQFLMAHDATISYKNLPLKLYELTRYSFRREQSGELTGLRRLRAFTMPDVHALVADIDSAMKEFKIRFNLCLSVLNTMGINNPDLEMALRTTKDFFEKNKPFILDLVKTIGKPILLEMWDERIFYFILKYEFNFVDNLDKASALSTDQIDIENGERYGMKFTDKDGIQKTPLVLHCSPSGAIERVMYALLEKAAFDQKVGKTPKLPLWLSPTQARIIPVAEEFTDYAMQITDELRKDNIRADLDDRQLHVGKKIRAAEIEWCSNIIVIGEKEKASGKLPIRVRGQKDLVEMTKEQFIENIKKETSRMPFKILPLPKELSKRPIFVG
ncbi:MAG: threonine--tRNA ligase [Nanoarchaeota archaeon]|nr:threonine--tRNA ligase [Nanoarchaeota archaeon]MBU1005674.1 threonine--tRNA ligase [Nanoarchaeota archaeon]MBU1946901.1 threonine--tRNA ligase [Nanoarchaeota archaeon]